MDDIAATPLPVTLWFETLPSDDTARLLIRSRAGETVAVLFWNEAPRSERLFPTRAKAEAWGYELRDALLQDGLAGALLGYDQEVLDRLQEQCSPR